MSLWQHVLPGLIPFRAQFERPGFPLSQHNTDTKMVVEAARDIEAIPADWDSVAGFEIDHERRALYQIALETAAGWHTAYFFRIKIPVAQQRRAKFEKRFLVYVFQDTFWLPASYNERPTRHISGGGWFVDSAALLDLKHLIRIDRLKFANSLTRVALP